MSETVPELHPWSILLDINGLLRYYKKIAVIRPDNQHFCQNIVSSQKEGVGGSQACCVCFLPPSLPQIIEMVQYITQ